ncbi:MAG: autotransporter domain-containing protein, partial [Planctomycetaceae bacterium]|nr:autotransporter domain-containing protein [Planctomycetaceae bacterium]
NVYLTNMRDDGTGGRIGGGTIEVDDDTILTVDGQVTDQPDGSSGVPPRAFGNAGDFRKDGNGTLILTNTANNYGGDTYVDSGTLVAVGLGTLGQNAAGKVLTTTNNGVTLSRLELRIDGEETLHQTLVGTGEVVKSGVGVLNLVDDSDFAGLLTVQSGRLHLTADYGRTNAFRVESGGILSGTGILGSSGSVGGVIASGGVVAPGGVTANDPLVNPTASPLFINGPLTFLAGSQYQVVLTQYQDAGYDPANPERMRPVSDTIVVNDGEVTIQDGAVLDITLDYWGDNLSLRDFTGDTSGVFTIIDAENNTTIADRDSLFQFTGVNLPNGVELMQGWNDNLFQLWFRGTAMAIKLPSFSHNQRTVYAAANSGDAGLTPLLFILSDTSIPRAHIPDIYNQLAGDIRANSLGMALKKPWRHPFNRLTGDFPGQGGASMADGEYRPLSGIWAEFYGRRTDMRSDGNAYNHDIDRAGVVVGYQRAFSPQVVLGAALNGSIVDMKQRTGTVDMDDLELGVYGLGRVGGWVDVKGYFGFGRQFYDVTRRVNIPAYGGAEPLNDRFENSVNGHSLAASVELSRSFEINRILNISPVAAFDYEHVWQKSYRESGSVAALHYSKADMAYMALRAGVNVGLALSDRVNLNGRLHYSRRIGEDVPQSEQRFVAATTARAAKIWGVKSGRDALNIGLSATFALDRRGRTSLHINYDGDFSRRGTSHTGNFGITHTW